MPEAEKTPDQIPWTERTKVTHLSDTSAWFEQARRQGTGRTTAECFSKDFEWSVTLDSKSDIESYMDLDERLTKSIQDFWEVDKEEHYSSSFQDRILRWLKGGGRQGKVKLGPKEWRPHRKGHGPVGKLTDEYGYGNTYNEDNTYYWGDMFEFAHIETEEGEEGAVILWNTSGGPMGGYTLPEVWLGTFSDFMLLQSEYEPYSYETFLNWNANFENAFMWGFEKLGYFDDWDEHVIDFSDSRVQGVLEAIEKDPSILLPESVQKILDRFEDFPKEIQKAVQWLMANKRREIEKALGQQLLWKEGELYGD